MVGEACNLVLVRKIGLFCRHLIDPRANLKVPLSCWFKTSAFFCIHILWIRALPAFNKEKRNLRRLSLYDMARIRIVIALRSLAYIGKGTLPHVLQIPYMLMNKEDKFVTYVGLDLFLTEILLNHRNFSDVIIYAFDHDTEATPVMIVDAKINALRFAGIPVAVIPLTNWNDLVSRESPFTTTLA